MVPRKIKYKVDGDVLMPLVYIDISKLMDEYDTFMVNIKEVRHKKKRGA